jgi:hypothetical protein
MFFLIGFLLKAARIRVNMIISDESSSWPRYSTGQPVLVNLQVSFTTAIDYGAGHPGFG